MFPLDNIISTDNNQIAVDKEDNYHQDPKKSYVSNEIYNNEKDENCQNNNYKEVETGNEEEKEKVVVNEPFMQAFKSWRFHLFNFMSVGTLCK